jgi:hypothetical protein
MQSIKTENLMTNNFPPLKKKDRDCSNFYESKKLEAIFSHIVHLHLSPDVRVIVP